MMSAAIRILYVDDEPSLLNISKLLLEESGDFAVTTAISAPEGIRLLEQEKFNAIISDYQMPGMNGIQFLVEVRARFGPIPFILFTGRGREEIVIQAINSGVDFYIQKGGEPGAQFAELSHKIRMAVERHTTGKALKESEARFRALVENASDIIRILDREGRIVFDTGASERLLGYPCGYTIGKSPMEFVHPDDLEMVKRELSEVYNSTNTGIPTEFRLKRADGSYTYVESSGKNLLGVSGIDGIVITTRFIDERKNADKALLESEEKYRSILKASPDDITITDLKGVISMVSPASLTTFGYKREEDLVGHSIADFLVPEDRARAADNIALMHHGVFSGPGEYCAIRGNGSTFDIEANGEFIRDAGGQPTGMVFIVRDITGRKRAEEKLRQQTDAMEAAIDGLALLNADQNYIYMNRAHAEIYGYANDSELVGKSWRIFYDSDELQRFEQEIMPEMGKNGHYQGRAIGRKKDGSTFPQEISLTALENGGLICVVRDITEGKLAEERLKESEEKFRATIGLSLIHI